MPVPKIYYHRDPQQDPPVCFCSSCGEEIYDPEEGEVCRPCRAQLRRYDPETVTAVLEAVDIENAKWLSADVCATVHNAIALMFPIYEEQ